ncbi:hypothetical protein ACEQ8H_007216 [Pleosporales sp. CAS-2024a]
MMDARDEAVAHLTAADDTTIAASPPRRDPAEDADPSFTRKRPRLDSGSNSNSALSADIDAPPRTATSPREQQVDLTIRSQHPPPSPSSPSSPSSPPSPMSLAATHAPRAEALPDHLGNIAPIRIPSTESEPESPPVMLVHDDPASALGFAVQLDAADYFDRFPCAQAGNYSKAVRDLSHYVQTCKNCPRHPCMSACSSRIPAISMDPQLLAQLELWLTEVPDPCLDPENFYTRKALFWDEFSLLAARILARRIQWMNAVNSSQSTEHNRYPFGDELDEPSVDGTFDRFLVAYVRLCSFLLAVDAQILSQQLPEHVSRLPVLSHKHMRALYTILRLEKTPVLLAMHKEYGVSTQDVNMRMPKDFLAASGAQNLLRMVDEAFHRVPPNIQNNYATYTSQILCTLGWTIFELPGEDTFIERQRFHQGVLSFFQKYGADLYDPSPGIDAGVARDLILYHATLAHELCQWDDSIAPKLMAMVQDLGEEPDSPTTASIPQGSEANNADHRENSDCDPSLASYAYKFKLLHRYIIKGNMGLRVMSIATMDTALVEVWREFSKMDPSCKHPIIQYLADFLLQGQVVDYIVSVDSHPQLISRSGNIAGFLVIAHRWSDGQADAIWKNVSSSPDPRVVAATMTMLRSIVNLMTLSDRLYLCTKLHDLPIDRYTVEILRFFRVLTTSLNENGSSIHLIEKEGRGPTARPWNVCIRVIRETAPNMRADKNFSDLQHEAFDLFRFLMPAIPSDQRHIIYHECVQQIATDSETATGNYRIFCCLAQFTHPEDKLFFGKNSDLIRKALGGVSSFVEKERQNELHAWQLQAFQYRLEFLKLVSTHPLMTIPADLYQDIWDHIVGAKALSNEARDLAWSNLHQVNTNITTDDFCKQLVFTYIPSMDPRFYTPGLFGFVACYSFPVTKKVVETESGTDTLLQIPGADLLWSLMLSSPTGTIEEPAARLLATRYVDVIETPGVTLAEVEKAQVALVEECMLRLRTAIDAQSKTTVDDVKAHYNPELDIRRILMFQKLLLGLVRQKPDFNRGQRTDSKVDAMDTEMPYDCAVTIRYQCGNDRHCVIMSSDHTVDDLYRRLCHATGLTKINLFARGQRLKVFEETPSKLSDVEFGGQVIVQRADGAELTRSLPDLAAGSSAFETAVVKHFDELFLWMDSGSTISQLLFEFLTFFPTRSSFADKAAQGEVSSEDLFPSGKIFQARYSALALQSRLREQIRDVGFTGDMLLFELTNHYQSALNEAFLRNAVQYLVKAFLNGQLMDGSFRDSQELQLAAVMVSVLLEFLRERPTPDTSAAYFSHECHVVDRLMKVILVALKSSDLAPVAQDAYATILEASLHSRAIWEAFMVHAETTEIHEALLLAQPQRTVREYIARKIASICGGLLPSTCPITKADTGSRFWTILSAMIPKAVQYTVQSKEFFEISEHVFRANDEYDRDEGRLRSLLTSWGTLLVDHNHEEIPGREEIDFVVLGLTKLLLCCLLSLKSFKKPINAGQLMELVFKKYIFVTGVQTGAMSHQGIALPILESHTRQELYDLMLGLVEDQATYENLLQLAGEVENAEVDPVLPLNFVDRSMEIRSTTGYVGLYNPRAICYMNSLLTQLFMNLNFRQFMLELNVHEAMGSQRLLFETQRLFAQMQNSYRKWTDPRGFAACVKSLEKTPLDITVQMDVDEFYNLLFDQWEAQMFKPEHKQKFRTFYGGQTMNQIKSKECEHVSERVEPFFAVQCDIAGKANLQESLQAYIQGDVMEGDNKYKCESCDGKFVDAVKRTCLKDAPDNLIFHLKRFEFDLNDFSRKKIYDHFAFPETLDISPYKFDTLANPDETRQEDIFDLVGVLVHTGTCENGHYYSYIRQRPSSSKNASSTWVEFNDSEVVPFDPSEIADRTFGGFTDGDAYSRQIKQFSAYMLFYQRRSAIEDDQRQWSATWPDRTPQIDIAKSLEQETNVNNELLIREYSLFDPAHTKFVRQLHCLARKINHGVCSEDHEQEARALRIVLSHLGHIAWRQSSSGIALELLVHVRRTMMSCSACCCIALMWLATDEYTATNTLIRCTHNKIRSNMRALLVDSLKCLRDKDPTSYGLDTSDSDMEMDASAPADGVLVAVIRRLRTTAEETCESVRGWEDYYLLLTQVAEMGIQETAVLLNHGFLQFCLKLFCMHGYQPFKADAPEFARIMEKRRGIFNRLICFLWKLLSQTGLDLDILDDDQVQDRLPTFDRQRMRFPLSRQENVTLSYWSEDIKAIAFLDKILEVFDDAKTDHFYPGDIIKWMFETPNEKIQANLFRTMIEGIQMEPPYCDAYIQAALPFCEACLTPDHIARTIGAVSRAVALPNRAADDRWPCADLVLRLFFGLLTAENEVFFRKKHTYGFHHYLLARSSVYGVALLCHFEEPVRKSTFALLQRLYANREAMPIETVSVKYKSARDLVAELMHRFLYERDVGRNRSFMIPLVDTCQMLVEQLYMLAQSQEPEALLLQHPDDATLICQFQQEVEQRMGAWPHDVGTPLSQGEAFDQSDYASESDEGQELAGH